MADRKISELTNITGADLADADEFALVDTSADETKAITFGEFKTALDTATGFVRITGDTMTGNLTVPNVVVSGNVDGRDVSADGTKLDTVETNADVTDATNVTAAGALMDNELANLAAVKAINQGLSTSDSPSFDAVTVGGTSDPSSEMTILSSIGGTSELRLGDTDADAGSIKYFNSNDQLVLRAAAATRAVFSSTGVGITGKTTTDELDLNAIASTISDTAVDIFVYDTRKDSDGGAWRKRTQGTSWYNEAASATRGSRKEFPAVAVIVAESSQITIYDGDDPDLPMWMVFNHNSVFDLLRNISQGHVSSTYALNGSIFVTNANGNGLSSVSFLDDTGFFFNTSNKMVYNGSVSQREEQLNHTAIKPTGIINGSVNDVAMTVLPNAPIDAATGLPVPTIAVATDGGLSVITDSGAVYDNVQGTQGYDYVVFDNENGVYFRRNTTTGLMRYASAAEYTSGDGFGAEIARTTAGTNDFDLLTWGSMSSYPDGFAMGGGSTTGDAVSGLMLRYANLSDRAKGMSALTTSSYNTGWMNGDIKLATLSDTDDTNVTGSELVTNGTFASDVSGWTGETDTSATYDSGRLKVTKTASSGPYGIVNQTITTIAGKQYLFQADSITGSGPSAFFRFNDGALGAYTETEGTTHRAYFTATSTSTKIAVGVASTSASEYIFWDNISVQATEEDRSVNGNGLQVFGTVTKSAVATGADLVAYGGTPSISNYLYQPKVLMDYTNDFCVMSWSPSGEWTWQLRDDDAGSFQQYQQTAASLYTDNSGNVFIRAKNYTQDLGAVGAGHIAIVHRASFGFEVYVNGVLKHSNSSSNTIANAYVYIGMRHYSANEDAGYSKQSLFRISATAPSPEQIKKIYEDEKVLFQEGAQATLYGSSDAVTALSYDDTTDLLHVGTSAGRSVFQGLRRVDNTTTAVGAAISASGGLVADE